MQIYTTFDVALHLNTIAAMFLRANEIEELLRAALAGIKSQELASIRRNIKQLTDIELDEASGKRFSPQEIVPSDSQESGQRLVDAMVFSDYMKCIDDPAVWETRFASVTAAGITKEQCLRSLNDARLARNKVMHFNRSDDLDNLIPSFEALAVWLRKVVANNLHE